MSEEIFDVVNERDEVVGRAPRSEVHAHGLLHRAVHVLIFNARGELFLQKRSKTKDREPSRWVRPLPAMWIAARSTTRRWCVN